MKRFLCVFLSLLFILSLSGCYSASEEPADAHTFHYRRAEFQYGIENGVIGSERRDISGHAGDLFYLITLYLSGPLESSLVSPFHPSTKLLSVEQNDSILSIVLTDSGVTVPDSDFAVACICLTMTCLELSGVEQVMIQCRDRSISLTREDITLYDVASIQSSVLEENK